jgi:hypothetical protein
LDFGAVPGSSGDALSNQKAINAALAALQPCDTLVIPADNVFKVVGGIKASGLLNNTLLFDGTLSYDYDEANWPRASDADSKFAHCIEILDSMDIALSSSLPDGAMGVIDGGGKIWWDKMIAGTLPNGDSRPRMLEISNSVDVLVERLHMVNSPSWNLVVSAARAEIRHVEVEVDRDYQRELKEAAAAKNRAALAASNSAKDKLKEWLIDELSGLIPSVLLQPEDLNTDGIDPSGVDFYIHDVKISNDDDSIAVKPCQQGQVFVDGTTTDCTRNMFMENMELVGFGASIGSVPPTVGRKCVDAITMKNVSMPGTGKGIYVKSNGNDCLEGKTSQLTNLHFENFQIVEPWWYAIWIGPQQQHEPGSDLGLDCALIYPLHDSQCPTQGCSDFENITLKDVLIENPYISPGGIFGNSSNPMRNIVFDNVVVKQDSKIAGRWPWREDKFPFKGTYHSEHVEGVCINGCDPVPEGFVVQ